RCNGSSAARYKQKSAPGWGALFNRTKRRASKSRLLFLLLGVALGLALALGRSRRLTRAGLRRALASRRRVRRALGRSRRALGRSRAHRLRHAVAHLGGDLGRLLLIGLGRRRLTLVGLGLLLGPLGHLVGDLLGALRIRAGAHLVLELGHLGQR